MLAEDTLIQAFQVEGGFTWKTDNAEVKEFT